MEIAHILVKKLNGTISVEEQKFFENWFKESNENRNLFLRLQSLHNKGEKISKVDDIDIESAWTNVLGASKTKKNKIITHLLQLSKYAAIFVGLISVAVWYWQTTLPEPQELINEDSITLQLDNGEIQPISTEKIQTITNSAGKILGIQNGIQLNYLNNSEINKLSYNVLTVPYGKTFKLILSDSTTVYLNAGSSLKYPVKFINGQNRQVFLTGEGYFDVYKDKKHPFIVTNGTMDVRVLGTKFNISAYPEDKEINTVLVEGSVSLYHNQAEYKTETSSLLEPNHQASWNRLNDNVTIKTVDTDIYTSWITGKLVIKKMPFKNIIQKLERHYKVSINNTYEQLNNQEFTATFDIESIEDVLATFSLETPFEFTKIENHIEIYKSKNENKMPMK
ncbi:FecR family protein [Arenibacter palladensis]|uniref:FecR family protein n=1 Tax=Arenibacter palladensis TaxID=237373 RepID=UPI0026E37FFC|nr:FecR family protein [Arenibacter palladensis]MDO6603956.1 FecR family protein [Arenibacter palladensis]